VPDGWLPRLVADIRLGAGSHTVEIVKGSTGGRLIVDAVLVSG
jgi:hypothetical protein